MQAEGSKLSSMSAFPKKIRISTIKKLISTDFHPEKCPQPTSKAPPKPFKNPKSCLLEIPC